VESGRIVDLLHDPASGLGRALRPARSHESAPAGQTEWFLSYTSAAVPADWLSRLGDEIGSTVSLLGASIETVDGTTVGHATVGIRGSAPENVVPAARRLGLDARPTASAPARVLENVA
jgi:D-methionine transport system ATP-binding protein